ncbi:MAG: hypothetical protein EOM18_08070 [Clostridia bacterium]|nr:hypothetical protein [Clostridia bacterium]
MVSLKTVKAIRNEYKEYLSKSHPEWTMHTVNTHVSDAFYIWNNDIAKSFWECLVSEESMEEARIALYEYLEKVVFSDRAEKRTASYYKDLCMLKEYIDKEYGGIRERVGSEYDAEKVMYDYAKLVYEGRKNIDEAAKELAKKITCYGVVSHKFGCLKKYIR